MNTKNKFAIAAAVIGLLGAICLEMKLDIVGTTLMSAAIICLAYLFLDDCFPKEKK